MARHFSDWITGFLEYTEGLESPEIFRRWAGYAAIAATLQRRVRVPLKRRLLYPNTYTLLVGPPGSGKTTAIIAVKEFLREVKSVKLAPQSITKEKFYVLFARAVTTEMMGENETGGFSEMSRQTPYAVFADEFGTFLPGGDLEFLQDLGDIYDCPEPMWENTTKTSGEDRIELPCLTICGGTTQKFIAEGMTPKSFGMGLVSRIIFVYCDQLVNAPLDAPLLDKSSAERGYLVDDLTAISRLSGNFLMHSEAFLFASAWYNNGMKPVPTDPRFAEYCSRRITHLFKLAMAVSASRRDDMTILESDIEEALTQLLLVERTMGKSLDLLSKNPLHEQINEAYKFILLKYRQLSGKPVLESQLRYHLYRETPPQYIPAVIETLISAGFVSILPNTVAPNRQFIPVKPEELAQKMQGVS